MDEEIAMFEWISFHHISRELNREADALSKQALLLNEGNPIESEYKDGQSIIQFALPVKLRAL